MVLVPPILDNKGLPRKKNISTQLLSCCGNRGYCWLTSCFLEVLDYCGRQLADNINYISIVRVVCTVRKPNLTIERAKRTL